MQRKVLYGIISALLISPASLSFQATNDAAEPTLHEQFVSSVNQKTAGLWEATADNKFSSHTKAELSRLMGVKSLSNEALPRRVFTEEELAADIPENFDSAENWPQCKTIGEIRDQSNCGSCWAIAAAEAISDRYCVVANQTDVRISTADLLSCCFICGFGCNGGIPSSAWTWWVWVGLSEETCQPYPFAPCGHHSNETRYPPCPSTIYDTPSCSLSCTAEGAEMIKHKGDASYSVSGEEAYQRELMTNGPFEVAFTVYNDFVAYKKGIYFHTDGDSLGGHAVKLVGWGVEDGVKYWKIANSWNEDWGEKGYFRIRRGDDECGIESSGVAGVPKKL
ncbi:cysteine peptidase C [Angomonas deanei]|nr:cysteine peptidase C [Angomonas deanei]EPY42975.1 cysteine peptidase C [Angomonas deanei]|eukprot:EPY42505.1 cysteine peptidase C [Angomonas deanei]